MKKIILINIILFVFSSICLGQTANDYFHGGAQAYIQGDYQTASQAVEEGLVLFPSDSKLLALKEKLEQQKKDQEQQNEDQQQQQEEQQKEQEGEEDKEQEKPEEAKQEPETAQA